MKGGFYERQKKFLKSSWYEGQRAFLKSTGGVFWFPKLTEKRYFRIRLTAAVLFGVAAAAAAEGFRLPIWAAGCFLAAAVPGGFFFPRLALRISDRRDNERMMPDIRKLFEYVRIQTKAGMYLTNTLAACYLKISNGRLKQALMELNAQIIAANSISGAIRDFNEKFDNEYISQFCVIVLQWEESGMMAGMLEDMSGQITDMEKQLLRQKQNRMERKVLLITLLVFCGIILIGAYQLAMSFLSSVSGIMG